jgi:hypothetical protein
LSLQFLLLPHFWVFIQITVLPASFCRILTCLFPLSFFILHSLGCLLDISWMTFHCFRVHLSLFELVICDLPPYIFLTYNLSHTVCSTCLEDYLLRQILSLILTLISFYTVLVGYISWSVIWISWLLNFVFLLLWFSRWDRDRN